jgi:hypothetical protein
MRTVPARSHPPTPCLMKQEQESSVSRQYHPPPLLLLWVCSLLLHTFERPRSLCGSGAWDPTDMYMGSNGYVHGGWVPSGGSNNSKSEQVQQCMDREHCLHCLHLEPTHLVHALCANIQPGMHHIHCIAFPVLHDVMSAWCMSAWCMSAWCVSAWCMSAWCMSAWCMSAWCMSAWCMSACCMSACCMIVYASSHRSYLGRVVFSCPQSWAGSQSLLHLHPLLCHDLQLTSHYSMPLPPPALHLGH